MATRVETLTAYKCRFSYLQRNNPLIEEQREAIKAGKEPDFSFSDFIEEYKKYTGKLVIGENSDRAITLDEGKIEFENRNGFKVWHIMPNAGKQGKPITVMKQSGKKYDFKSDAAALYEYHIFIYESENGIIAIFHRQNGSGCKSVFLETANKAIKSKGVKLEMNLIVPLSDTARDIAPTKIIMQYTKEELSSDVTDNYMNGTKKKRVIRELGLNLEENENKKILSIVKSRQMGEIDKAKAFALITAELNDDVEYNDAELKLRIGKRRQRSVQWNDFERIAGIHDISYQLQEAYLVSHDYVYELFKLADEYYEEIVESEEV